MFIFISFLDQRRLVQHFWLIFQICIKIVEVISRNLEKCVFQRRNFPIIALNTWVTCLGGNLNS